MERKEHAKLSYKMGRVLGRALLDLHALERAAPAPCGFRIEVFDPNIVVAPPPTREQTLAALVDSSVALVEERLRQLPDAPLHDNCNVAMLVQEREDLIDQMKEESAGKQSSRLLLMSPRDSIFGLLPGFWNDPYDGPLREIILPEEGRILELLSQEYFFCNAADMIDEWILFRPRKGLLEDQMADPQIGILGIPSTSTNPAAVVGLYSKPDAEEDPSIFVSILDEVPPAPLAETKIARALRHLSCVNSSLD